MKITTTKKRNKITKSTLTLQNDLFAKTYATDPECLGNATMAYMKAYNTTNAVTAKVAGARLLNNVAITNRIHEYLEADGFNDLAVDKKHNFLIKQNKDFSVSLKAIQEYNKLKKRIVDRLEISLPKPILSLSDGDSDEDEDQPKIKTLKKDKDTGEYR